MKGFINKYWNLVARFFLGIIPIVLICLILLLFEKKIFFFFLKLLPQKEIALQLKPINFIFVVLLITLGVIYKNVKSRFSINELIFSAFIIWWIHHNDYVQTIDFVYIDYWAWHVSHLDGFLIVFTLLNFTNCKYIKLWFNKTFTRTYKYFTNKDWNNLVFKNGKFYPDLSLKSIAGEGKNATDREVDIFNTTPFAQTIVDAIVDIEPRKAFVIGLEGEWGSGKSSVFDQIEVLLPLKKNNYEIIRFTPWYSHGYEALIHDFFKLLEKEIKGSILLKYKLNDYAKVVTEVSDKIINIEKLSGFFTEDNTITSRYKNISDELLDNETNYLIMIDDLDRLNKDEVVSVLKLIRIIADFPRIVYLVAYDKDYISEAVASELGMKEKKEEFLDKFISVVFKLPKPYYERIAEQLSKSLKENFSEIIKEELVFNEIEKVIKGNEKYITSIISKPRDIKRFLNNLYIKHSAAKNITDFLPLVLLEIINYKGSYILKLIYDNEDKMTQMSSSQYKEQMRKEKTAFVPGEKHHLSELEGKGKLSWDDIFFIEKIFSSYSGDKFSIARPLYFNNYFILSLVLEPISQKDINDIYNKEIIEDKEFSIDFPNKENYISASQFEKILSKEIIGYTKFKEDKTLANGLLAKMKTEIEENNKNKKTTLLEKRLQNIVKTISHLNKRIKEVHINNTDEDDNDYIKIAGEFSLIVFNESNQELSNLFFQLVDINDAYTCFFENNKKLFYEHLQGYVYFGHDKNTIFIGSPDYPDIPTNNNAVVYDNTIHNEPIEVMKTASLLTAQMPISEKEQINGGTYKFKSWFTLPIDTRLITGAKLYIRCDDYCKVLINGVEYPTENERKKLGYDSKGYTFNPYDEIGTYKYHNPDILDSLILGKNEMIFEIVNITGKKVLGNDNFNPYYFKWGIVFDDFSTSDTFPF